MSRNCTLNFDQREKNVCGNGSRQQIPRRSVFFSWFWQAPFSYRRKGSLLQPICHEADSSHATPPPTALGDPQELFHWVSGSVTHAKAFGLLGLDKHIIVNFQTASSCSQWLGIRTPVRKSCQVTESTGAPAGTPVRSHAASVT